MPTLEQIKKIHALKRALGLDDATYRLRLESYGAESCKELTDAQTSRFIEGLERQALDIGVWKQLKQPRGRKKYDNRKPTLGRASAAQLRLVEALFDQVARAEKGDARAAALNKLIRRIVKKDKIEFLTDEDVPRLVKTLEAMGAEKVA
ncbi:MAG: DUF1018 domain-containing protein [Desulfovibrionaceae bacterium]|nr:DUF1018 domain-containing protein [Desulfovibrionaceae bacterium]MBF0513655.1 DUF1018 domain-containing protein [Desulfovibrionaceae bacterium]